MATEASEGKLAKASQVGAPPQATEHFPCPRCDSTNTKFCYYNNYNASQPRHFCKNCRRYWTHGGTLRHIPIGGATRKNTKRSRTSAASSATQSPTASAFSPDFRHFPTAAAASKYILPFSDHGGSAQVNGSFTSLLNGNVTGFELGLGLGLGLDEVGFGLGRSISPFPAAVEAGPAIGSGGSVSGLAEHMWQLESGEDGGYFALPDLAISTPGSVLK